MTSDEKELGTFAQVIALSRRPVFVTTVASLCGLYFTVSAVQYWASHFFISEFRRSATEVTTLFIFVAGTAPILGVVMGSTVIDRSGGYETPQRLAHALGLTTAWGFLASFAGVVVGFIEPATELPGASGRFYSVVGCLYVVLFFGGAMVPAVTGIGMASVPEGLRKSASSWSMLLYNVFGFSLGAYLPGYIGEVYTIRFAMQIVFLSAFVSAGSVCWAYMIAARAVKSESVANRDCREIVRFWRSSPRSQMGSDICTSAALCTAHEMDRLSAADETSSNSGDMADARLRSRPSEGQPP